MPDYTSVLSEIANAVKIMAGEPSYSWLTPIVALVSAGIGYWASQRTIAKQVQRQLAVDKEKRKLIFHLLYDEITKRWNNGIRPFLLSLLDMTPIDGLGHLATTEIHREDLLILKLLSESFSDYYFIGDNRLISEIVGAHMLIGDLVDIRNHAASVVNEYRRVRKELLTSLSEEEVNKKLETSFSRAIQSLWKEFTEKLKEIDKRFEDLLAILSA